MVAVPVVDDRHQHQMDNNTNNPVMENEPTANEMATAVVDERPNDEDLRAVVARLTAEINALKNQAPIPILRTPDEVIADARAEIESKEEAARKKDRQDAKKELRKHLFNTLPKYSGARNPTTLRNFIRSHRTYSEIAAMSDQEQILVVEAHLTADAKLWFSRLKPEGTYPETVEELFEMIQQQFIGITQKDDARHQLKRLRYDGSITTFNQQFQRLKDAAELASEGDPIPQSDMERYYVIGLRYGAKGGNIIADALLASQAINDLSVSELMKAAERAFQKAGYHDKKTRANRPHRAQVEVNAARVSHRGRGRGRPFNRQVPGRMGQERRCYNCNRPGHFAYECRAPPRESRLGGNVATGANRTRAPPNATNNQPGANSAIAAPPAQRPDFRNGSA